MERWREAAARLRDAGMATPGLDARLLLAHVCGMSPGQALLLTSLDADQDTAYQNAIDRRLAGEPVSRIMGQRGFWKHDFGVSPATLDPRADSETLIELTLRIVTHQRWREQPISILDLGTGTGCLLLTLLDELPNACGTGVDISDQALETARANAARLNLTSRADFVLGNWFEGLSGPFDMIISNPPYIASSDIPQLMIEVRKYDPLVALDGGTDGLDAYRQITRDAQKHLVAGGWLVFECGAGQSDDVLKLMHDTGFRTSDATLSRAVDLAGVERCVAGQSQ